MFLVKSMVKRSVLFTSILALMCGLFASTAQAATETYDTNPGPPLTNPMDLGTSGPNPGTYGSFDYSYRNGARVLALDVFWGATDGVGATGSIETDYNGGGAGRELDIARHGGGVFTFKGLTLSNWSGTRRVFFQGWNGTTMLYTSEEVNVVAFMTNPWTTYTPVTAWSGITELRIVSAENATFDPAIDNFVYSLATPPTATSTAASGITFTGAILNGTVNANNASTTVSFEYGLTSGYGTSVTALQSPVSGVSNTAVSANIPISCGTTYHFRVKAVNDGGTTYGSDQVFSTACNIAPTFVGAVTTLTVSQNAGVTDIKGLLHVSDSDSGQTETWSQSAAPDHGGILSFSGATASSGSTDITPGGTVTYQPAGGYAGSESFTVRVSDGTAIATRTITVTVNPSYTVTYNGNGNTGGGVPTDASRYLSGATVTVLGNTGTLTRTGYTFSGWNTAADGSGTSYAASGSTTFTMGAANVTLYATWTIKSYTVTPSAGSNGSISPGTAVTVVHGGSTSFTIKPAAGFQAVVPLGGTCPAGTYTGSIYDTTGGISYTTGAISGDCTVAAEFLPAVCGAQPTGLISWWKGENNAMDSIGGNNGLVVHDKENLTQTVGENATATLSCSAGKEIVASSTVYGSASAVRSCGSCTTGAASCSITFSNSSCGGDPAVGVVKQGTLYLVCASPVFTYIAGVAGKAFSFNGTGDYITQGSTYKGKASSTANSGFTMEFWARPTGIITNLPVAPTTSGYAGITGQRYAIFPELQNSATEAGAGVSVGTNGVVVVEHAPDFAPAPLVYVMAPGDIPAAGWLHIAVVYEGMAPKLYLNGVAKASGVSTGRTVYPSSAFGEIGNGYGYYQGGLDEVHIFNRALNAAEVQGLYTASGAGMCSIYNLAVGIIGSGSVTSKNQSGTNYTCLTPTCDAVPFTQGDTVTMTATGSNSTFSAWSGDVTGSSNPGSFTMDGHKMVVATFTADPARVAIDGSVTPYYTISAALDACGLDTMIRALSTPVFGETITMTTNHNLKLRGGFTDPGFTDIGQTGYSTISGWLKIKAGKLMVQRIVIKP